MSTRLVKSKRIIVLWAFMVLSAFGMLWSQSLSDDDSSWFAGWQERAAKLDAYRTVPAAELQDAAKAEAISWLDKDADYASRHFQKTGAGLGEAFGEYYIDLTLFVAGLKDPRSINALTKVMDVAGRVSTTLAEFGDAAVEPVLGQLNNPVLRKGAIFTLGKFVEGSQKGKTKISDANIKNIKQAVLNSARDPLPPIRVSAVNALKYFQNDAEVTKRLQELADNDPYSVVRDPSTKIPVFPVRRAAKAALGETTK